MEQEKIIQIVNNDDLSKTIKIKFLRDIDEKYSRMMHGKVDDEEVWENHIRYLRREKSLDIELTEFQDNSNTKSFRKMAVKGKSIKNAMNQRLSVIANVAQKRVDLQ